jgi:hypothetical protein
LLKAGTIVDATMIGALSSTKNATQTREIHVPAAQGRTSASLENPSGD